MKRGWLIAGTIFGALLMAGAIVGLLQVGRIKQLDADFAVTDPAVMPMSDFALGLIILCIAQLLGGAFLLWRATRALRRQAAGTRCSA